MQALIITDCVQSREVKVAAMPGLLPLSLDESAAVDPFGISSPRSVSSRSFSSPTSPRATSTLRRSGLVTTSASYFTGPPPGTTLRDLSAEPDFVNLEIAQRTVYARRVELLKRQAALSREAHEVLSNPQDGMLVHAMRSVHSTQMAIVDSHKHKRSYSSPQRLVELEKNDFLGVKSAEMLHIQKELAAGEGEEFKIAQAIANRHPGASVGRGPRASSVTSLAAWRAVYGSPTGALVAATTGFESQWSPTPRHYGTSLPGSGPHGHRTSKVFTGFASQSLDLKLGRGLK